MASCSTGSAGNRLVIEQGDGGSGAPPSAMLLARAAPAAGHFDADHVEPGGRSQLIPRHEFGGQRLPRRRQHGLAGADRESEREEQGRRHRIPGFDGGLGKVAPRCVTELPGEHEAAQPVECRRNDLPVCDPMRSSAGQRRRRGRCGPASPPLRPRNPAP